MAIVGATSATSGTGTETKRINDLNDLQASDFLQLMITELQQQDPLNPMDNNEMVQQINSIREMAATTSLTDTLGSVVVGQNISTASGLIGKTVKALDDDGNDVSGEVERVSVLVDPKDEKNREVRVHIGSQQIKLSNIREIVE